MDVSIPLVNSISTSSPQNAAVGASSTPRVSTPQSSTPSPLPHDTIQLSTTSQVQSLKQSGASVSQIASSLGLTSAEVDQDLGISTSSSSSEASILAALSARH